ncbi:hypothetical protein OAG63_01830 [Methylacidiphilales bacterium]|nr:hypothetical protein [Candidatus Methylacidiphilales bacterium]
MIGQKMELGTGPYWRALEGVVGGSPVGAAVVSDSEAPYTGNCIKGGQLSVLTAINNPGETLGYNETYTNGLLPLSGNTNNALPAGTLNGLPPGQLINDNGVVIGSGVLWMPGAHGGFIRKSIPILTPYSPTFPTYGVTGYVNNKMAAANGWADYRSHDLTTLLTTTNWVLHPSTASGAISHDTSLILTYATQVVDNSGDPIPSGEQEKNIVELLPCRFSLLNGSTNQADVDGKFFDGTRPTTISATSGYNTQVTYDIGNVSRGNVGIDVIGNDLPLGVGRPDAPGQAYAYSLMMLAKVAPASANITYVWDRVYKDQSVTIAYTTTNTWYVNEAPGSSTTSVEDTGTNLFLTTTPSTNNNVVTFYDNPGMNVSLFTNTAPNTNDYAYEKTDFTYSLTNSIGSVSAVARQHIGQIIIAQRKGTSGVITNDWTGITNFMSTTNIPNCTTVTTSEIRAIVGGANTIIFDSSVPH